MHRRLTHRLLAKLIAHKLAPDVRVNGAAPGSVLGTDLSGAPAPGLGEMRVRADAKGIADLKQLKRLHVALKPAQIAESCVFPASDAATRERR